MSDILQLKITPIIIDAQKLLVTKPYDLAHDITHHYRVWEWCSKIVLAEKLSVNWPLLTIASWWHDAQDRRGMLIKEVLKSLDKNGAEENLQRQVANIIREHSFNQKQTSTEAKVLFDADKLEYVNPPRLGIFLQAAKEGFIPRKYYLTYKSDWAKRVSLIPGLLHYQYSRKKFIELKPKVIKLIKNIYPDFLASKI